MIDPHVEAEEAFKTVTQRDTQMLDLSMLYALKTSTFMSSAKKLRLSITVRHLCHSLGTDGTTGTESISELWRKCCCGSF